MEVSTFSDSGLQRHSEDRIQAGWNMVKGNVEKISDLVKSILYASKEREPDYKPCDPAVVISEVCDLFRRKGPPGPDQHNAKFRGSNGRLFA